MPKEPIGRIDEDIIYPSAIPFVLLHLAGVAVIWSGVSRTAAVICIALYGVRMFAIGAGYHRYFSHRAYATSRAFQFVLAFLAQSSAQKSVLWWASKHRHHHLHSDTDEDVHSPLLTGFIYSHIGWIFTRRHDRVDLETVRDLAAYPELLWLHRFELVPALVVGALCFGVAGWSGLVVGFVWSTIFTYHATFCINSLAHMAGRRRYVTGDESRNNWLLALVTMGEGWHNNHHAYQSSARQGFRWWELDCTYYLLQGLSCVGVVWNLRSPPPQVLRNEQRLGSRVVNRAAEQLLARFNPERIAQRVTSALHGADVAAIREVFAWARTSTSEALTGFHLPQLPRREELLVEARRIFARTNSLDAIVDRAYELLLIGVETRLVSARGTPA